MVDFHRTTPNSPVLGFLPPVAKIERPLVAQWIADPIRTSGSVRHCGVICPPSMTPKQRSVSVPVALSIASTSASVVGAHARSA